ncbi:arsinothricin resistance N-acetyltransferase ArsN1 family A [Alkaliphilus transvaalensis]|uniref:arsinothricin resistance N-acetyltransferase ArsN1 family A n=1 Tax=Alkaliphilus transvaalensis TaxID=114628 RepID=UPI00047A1BF0|nr:arsinothricin resistance N-acetyltransferase ArsN1 family A [Alkaliphilus transvaalensis]
MDLRIRTAELNDITQIVEIYNQGIEDKIATLETKTRNLKEMTNWFNQKGPRFKVIVVENTEGIIYGWASLNVFNQRECYDGVADFSIYIRRDMRGTGLGKRLLENLIEVARKEKFHKLVLSTFKINEAGQRLYHLMGFREVGTYIKQGKIGDNWVDITIMEKLLI